MAVEPPKELTPMERCLALRLLAFIIAFKIDAKYKLNYSFCHKVTDTKRERWVRRRVRSAVRTMTQVSSGTQYRSSNSLPRGHGNCREALSANSAHNQWAREEFKLSTLEFQTFRSRSGQNKTCDNAHPGHSRTRQEPILPIS